MKKSSSVKSLKRPGSPNLSEASGTDASTRKKKKHRHLSSTQPTPQPSRPISPSNIPPSSSAPDHRKDSLDSAGRPFIKKRKSMAPGSAGSDTETAAHSDGGAMSDASKNGAKRLKVRGGVQPRSGLTPQGGSRVASPKPPTAGPAPALPFPTAQEIHSAIPAEGIPSSELLRVFKTRVYDRREEFFTIVKGVARLDKVKKVLLPKNPGPAVS